MATTTVRDTATLDARERGGQWKQWIASQFPGLQADLYGADGFDGRMESSTAGATVLTRLDGGRHRVARDGAGSRAPADDFLKIVAPWQGTAEVSQFGRRCRVGRGQWVIYDTSAPYAIDNPDPTQHLIIMVPRARVVEAGLPLPALMARSPACSAGIARAALNMMRNTWHALPGLTDEAAVAAGNTLADLIRLSLLELSGRSTATGQRAILRDRIRGYVATHLADPDLDVARLATVFNCSRRQLYNAFEGEAESIAAAIQRGRLEASMRDLVEPALRGLPISDIAQRWGFGNMSHFSKAFRAHTGRSPREFRRLEATSLPQAVCQRAGPAKQGGSGRGAGL